MQVAKDGRADEDEREESDETHITQPITSQNGHPAKRRQPSKAKWYPGDWDEICNMLQSGSNRETIAGDYGVTLDELDAFIEGNESLGEAHAPGGSRGLAEEEQKVQDFHPQAGD